MSRDCIGVSNYRGGVMPTDGQVEMKIPSAAKPLRTLHCWYYLSPTSKFERAVKVGGGPLKNKTL